jgi:energy-coupling factor transporter transmembrane protein EcfT
MVDVKFEEDSAPARPRLTNQDSKLTVFLIKKSFGLIEKSQQAIAVQLVIAVGLLITAMLLFNSARTSATVTSPSPELIKAAQPIGPLR